MRGLKTITIGVSLLINFAAVLWTVSMFLNGKTLGNAAIVSLHDSYVAVALLALSFLANVILTVALLRRRRSRISSGVDLGGACAPPHGGTRMERRSLFSRLVGDHRMALGLLWLVIVTAAAFGFISLFASHSPCLAGEPAGQCSGRRAAEAGIGVWAAAIAGWLLLLFVVPRILRRRHSRH